MSAPGQYIEIIVTWKVPITCQIDRAVKLSIW